MIVNQLRTLLLNLPGSSAAGPLYPLEEYIPPGYGSLTLPANLQIFLNLLYGPGADRAAMNLKLRKILYWVHSTELAQYATALDPRITYWPPRDNAGARAEAFGASAVQTAGVVTPAFFSGDPTQPGPTNTLYGRWNVTVAGPSTVVVTPESPAGPPVISSYSVNGGVSSAVALPGSHASFAFGAPATPYPVWEITALARPAYDLPQVLAAFQTNGADALFGVGEPYTTLRQLWYESGLPGPHRLAAAVLALGYQINTIYTSAVAQ